ncbi:MAG: histidinol-phosphatase [Oscillospiraceae bacterium]
MIIDLHSHILPGFDDGARTPEESVAMLNRIAAEGIALVVATPHYYFYNESPEQFLARRDAAFQTLAPYLKPHHPHILLGAEVLYSRALQDPEVLSRFKIQGTDYLLLEMPYEKLTDKLIAGVGDIAERAGAKIIIAHVERYLSFTDARSIDALMNQYVLGQANTKSLSGKARKPLLKLMEKGFIHVLGTDFHRIESGQWLIREAREVLDKKFSPDFFDRMMYNAQLVLENKDMDEIL